MEEEITIEEIEGVEQTYGRWSLSWTHLMIVLAIDIANNTQITNNSPLAYFSLPAYIFNNIIPIFGTTVSIKTVSAYNDDFSKQDFTIVLNKDSESMRIRTGVNPLITNLRHMRIEFDLLIDNE